MIQVLDDVLAKQTQKYYLERVINVDWKYKGGITDNNDGNSGFFNLIYDFPNVFDNDMYNTTLPLFMEIVSKFDISLESNLQLYRFRLGMFIRNQINNTSAEHHKPHVDSEKPHYSLLYYCSDSDAPTYIFQDGEVVDKIECKQGRAVLLPGDVYHASSCPKEYQNRLVLNCNFGEEITSDYWR